MQESKKFIKCELEFVAREGGSFSWAGADDGAGPIKEEYGGDLMQESKEFIKCELEFVAREEGILCPTHYINISIEIHRVGCNNYYQPITLRTYRGEGVLNDIG